MGSQPETEILLISSISKDFIAQYPGDFTEHFQPEKLASLSVSFLLDELKSSYGGIAANIAYTLALLGKESTILTAVGNDIPDYLDLLKAWGVDISHIIVDPINLTSTFFAMTDVYNHQICGFSSGAMKSAVDISLKPWEGSGAIAVISAHDPRAMAKHTYEARIYGLKSIYDPSQQTATVPSDDLIHGIESAAILMGNESELLEIISRTGLSEDQINSLVPINVVTLGERGAIIRGSSIPDTIHIPAVKVPHVTNPTGAGDAFRSGFLYALCKKYDLAICGQMGSVAASFAIESDGTQNHFFTSEEFIIRYKIAFGETPML